MLIQSCFDKHLSCLHILVIENNAAMNMSVQISFFVVGPVANTLHSQCRGPGLNPLSGSYIPYAATKTLHAATKDPACGHEVLQLRPGAAK